MTPRLPILTALVAFAGCRATSPPDPPDASATGYPTDDTSAALDTDGSDDSGDDTRTGGSSGTAALPVAPSADAFGWQGRQDSFVDASGGSCSVPVVLAMGPQSTCFVAPDGELRCAGRIFGEAYGSSFTSTGLEDVTQVVLVLGDAACALVGGVPTCLGDYNFSGQLGNGGRDGSRTWTPWAEGGGGFWALATGTSDSYCAINEQGGLWCTGDAYGLTPILVDEGPVSAVWISTFGQTFVDDGVTFRASQARTECQVTAAGLDCAFVSVGRPGHVVDGALIDGGSAHAGQIVWLEDDGRVQLHTFVGGGFTVTTELFHELPVLAIASNYYTDSICAVYYDGSIACVGSNDQGKLGTGDAEALATPEVTQPAGTIDLDCR